MLNENGLNLFDFNYLDYVGTVLSSGGYFMKTISSLLILLVSTEALASKKHFTFEKLTPTPKLYLDERRLLEPQPLEPISTRPQSYSDPLQNRHLRSSVHFLRTPHFLNLSKTIKQEDFTKEFESGVTVYFYKKALFLDEFINLQCLLVDSLELSQLKFTDVMYGYAITSSNKQIKTFIEGLPIHMEHLGNKLGFVEPGQFLKKMVQGQLKNFFEIDELKPDSILFKIRFFSFAIEDEIRTIDLVFPIRF